MRNLSIILILLSSCFEADYQGPLWGDPCRPKHSPTTWYVCQHWEISPDDGTEQVIIGYCADKPGVEPFGGTCQPTCNHTQPYCNAGTPHTGDFGICYCDE